ncbi:hypothetical protein SARC_03030 [Sphaeroforma arctica JP610]|uniref:BHLH domain-containing protein n=1 Tax=Sphaeroforma arctica JP610 TaxID=667725 RepID=A0A0L0G766_9EUKA|nr:hypothetical protein SARC_03030 [Sphaeroforma arctica JP610]KNC84759.1 hypothetical protein SARC_03030 [Sphaeroforma arctica JP610]|eukprot:XP_014158661.1 hypothetical protein SARC_03030 [Sphaeroforma arctica JP610]
MMLTGGDALLYNPALNTMNFEDMEFGNYLDPLRFFGGADISLSLLGNDASSTDSGSDDVANSPDMTDASWPLPDTLGQDVASSMAQSIPTVPDGSFDVERSSFSTDRSSFATDRSSFASMFNMDQSQVDNAMAMQLPSQALLAAQMHMQLQAQVQAQANLHAQLLASQQSQARLQSQSQHPLQIPAVKSEPVADASVAQSPILNSSPVPVAAANMGIDKPVGVLASKSANSMNTTPLVLSVSSPITTESECVDAEDAARRRRAHLASEKKRRHNLKDAFDELKQTIPQCRNFPQSKSSKESVLRKAVDYISYLVRQRAQMTAEIQALRAQVKDMGGEPSGVPTVKQEVTTDYSTSFPPGTKTIILLGLLDAFVEEFDKVVSVSSTEELSTTIFSFFETYCQPAAMQNVIISSLKSVAVNFNPTTDGASCRIRKWMDSLNGCDVSAFDENVSSRLRSVLASVYTHYSSKIPPILLAA